jgi:hypothetical protein
MKLLGWSARLWDPEDPGGAGGDPGDEQPAPPPAQDSNAALKAVADSIKLAIAESRTQVAPAPIPTAPIVDPAATRRALETEATQVDAKFDELMAAGRASEAMNLRDSFIRKANTAFSTRPDDDPAVRVAVEVGERLARAQHTDIMKRWPDEVRRAVESMPITERITPGAWDRAVATVRSNHFTELLDEQVNVRVEEARRQFVPPPATPGSRGARQLTGAASKLTEEQLWGADICGVTPEEYAKEIAREEQYDSLPFKERAKFPGYPVMSDTRGSTRVEPGKF